MDNGKRNNEGYVLIISVALLATLVIMVMAFIVSAKLEQSSANNFTRTIKVKYVAEAAVAKAIVHLKYDSYGPLYDAVDATTEAWYGADPYSGNFAISSNETAYYTVETITDCASRINISDNNPNLDRMLTSLNAILGSPLAADDIVQIANNAPYETKEQLKSYLTGSDTERQTKYDAIKDYVTAVGYIDPYVVDPTDLSGTLYEYQPRAPININTAPREVLYAVFNGLRADNACPRCGGDGYINAVHAGHCGCPACGGQGQGRSKINGSGDLEITSDEAEDLADYLIDKRDNPDLTFTPFRTWNDIYMVIKSYANIGEYDGDLVMANCNPNTGFSWVRNIAWYEALGSVGKYVYDFNNNGLADNADIGLTASTTELSFNSGGYYEIEVSARLEDNLGNVTGSRNIITTVKIFDIYRQTSQAHFAGGSLTNLTSYPQPTAAGQPAADFSGQLAIKTRTYSQPSGGIHFRGNYEAGVAADSSGGTAAPYNLTGEPIVGNVASGGSRGDLQPDGMLVDYIGDVRPKYSGLDNVDANEGTYIIWFKPKYPGNDSKLYGDGDQDRKMIRLTGNSNIPGYSGIDGMPFETVWFWSDYNDLWSGAVGGGGKWNGSTWEFKHGWWWGWTSSGFPCWQKGEWQQMALTWKNPDDPYDTAQYNTTDNPLILYSNGNKLTTTTYYYHTQYGDSTTNAVNVACENDIYNHNAVELSNAVIGAVMFYPTKLTDNEILSDYLTGIYESSGFYVSATYDPPDVGNVEWGTITWTEAIPSAGGNVNLLTKTNGSWSAPYTDPFDDNQIGGTSSTIQYQVFFSSRTNLDTPILDDVTITYLGNTEIIYWKEY